MGISKNTSDVPVQPAPDQETPEGKQTQEAETKEEASQEGLFTGPIEQEEDMPDQETPDDSLIHATFVCIKKCYFDSVLFNPGKKTGYIQGVEQSPYFKQEKEGE